MTTITPAALGYRMPAEWERHQATWLSWPHNHNSWPGKFEPVEPVMVQAVRALATSETVHINVLDAAHEQHVRELLVQGGVVNQQPLQLHRFPTNDAWCRDHGAIFLTRQQHGVIELAALNCEYNAWGGKYPPYDLDNMMPRRMAEYLDIPRLDADMVLEGGSIDVNGAGAVLTTEQCLLNPNRNPRLSRGDIEQQLRALLGVDQVLWLGEGIIGDDTDGHVDDLTRFVATDTVVTVVEADPQDANYAVLQDNLQRLRALTLADGRALNVIELPMPAPLYYQDQRLPASYANFYIANQVILLPCFNDPNDAVATRILQECFPDRRIAGIDCRDLVWGLGAFHCLTQQVPDISR
jgi:agmatine deiminase